MGGNIGDIPLLQAPIDMTQWQETEFEDAAKKIIANSSPDSEYTVDEIVVQLEYMALHGITLKQSHIDNLLAGSPALPLPDAIELTLSDVNKALEANPWLKANPYAIFTINFLELAYLLSKIKMTEAEMAADAIGSMTALAKEVAELIIKIGWAEATAQIVAGIAAIAKAICSVAGAVHAKGKDMFEMQRITMGWQAGGELAGSAGNFAQAWAAVTKSAYEAAKTLTENMQKIADRQLNAALDAYKTNDEMISQILQNLQKVIDEAYRAHGWAVH